MQKNGWTIKCAVCEKERYVVPSLVKAGRGKYCSMSCRSKVAVYKMHAARGDSWRRSIRRSMLIRFKDKTKHPRWKGNGVGYFALHDWVEKVLGKPSGCKICGTTEDRAYHWANKSGEYKRHKQDWMRVCVPCHRKYDYARKKSKKN